MKVAIIKYNAGNIYSVACALNRVGVDPIITDDPEVIRNADKVIFPGVGQASTTMEYLRTHKLDELIVSLKQPVLGICIGMQLMCKHSDEGNVDCLGIFDQSVLKFTPSNINYKIPHMGWNTLVDTKGPLMQGVPENSYVYFVHSYYVPLGAETMAKSDYIEPFSAIVQKDNFYAAQFHIEKSGLVGETILKNFLNL